ncbi:MAG: hypothetical protein ACK5M7_18915 [Draconibacterium sp.]
MVRDWYENTYLKTGNALYTPDNLYIVWEEARLERNIVSAPCYFGVNNTEEQAWELNLVQLKNSKFAGMMVQKIPVENDTLRLVYSLDKGLHTYRYLQNKNRYSPFLSAKIKKKKKNGAALKSGSLDYGDYLGIFVCPEGLMFNGDAGECDFEENITPHPDYGYTCMYIIRESGSQEPYYDEFSITATGYDCTDYAYEVTLLGMLYSNLGAFIMTYGGFELIDAQSSIHNLAGSNADCEYARAYYEDIYYSYIDNSTPDEPIEPDEEEDPSGGGGSGGTTGGENPGELPEVILDTATFVGTKAECVKEKLDNQNLINQLIGGFDLEESKISLIYKVEDLEGVNGLCSYNPNTKRMEIKIDTDRLIESSMELARTILHESFHAYIFGKLYESELHTGLCPEPNFEDDFRDYAEKYGEGENPQVQHNYIADKYIVYMKQGLKDYFDGESYKTSFLNYVEENEYWYGTDFMLESLSWGGLQKTDAWFAYAADSEVMQKYGYTMGLIVPFLPTENCEAP